jgi:hypothetical protein
MDDDDDDKNGGRGGVLYVPPRSERKAAQSSSCSQRWLFGGCVPAVERPMKAFHAASIQFCPSKFVYAWISGQ